MIMTGIAFLAAGYLLLRSAANPARAGLIWTVNPLLIYLLVMGAQLDAFLALAGIAAILISRRGTTIWYNLAVGLLIGVALGIKISAVFVALGIAVPLIRERAWVRLLCTGTAAATCTLTLAWVLVAPWSLPWYTALAWVTLALLPRSSLSRWLTLATLVPAMLRGDAGAAGHAR
jgi:hypothetical protein